MGSKGHRQVPCYPSGETGRSLHLDLLALHLRHARVKQTIWIDGSAVNSRGTEKSIRVSSGPLPRQIENEQVRPRRLSVQTTRRDPCFGS